jgi:hypothetical protein
MKTVRVLTGIMLLVFCGLSFAQGGPAQADRPGRRVLIGFQEAIGPRTPEARAAVVQNAGGQVHASFSLIPVVSARLPEPAIANLQGRPDIAYVEDDVKMSIVQSPPQTISWGVDRIDADRAWSTNTGAGVDVAILDTGIDYDHPDLQANIRGGIYFAGWIIDELLGKDGSTNPADWNDGHGHGTHCAGIVAAVNNTIGVVGVAPGANLWGVKVLGDDGSGYTSDIVQGLQWCATHGIEVASMSFGGGGTTSLQNACHAAYDAGVFLVAAAGNDYGGPVIYPAAYAWVTAVSAVGQNPDGSIYLAPFSNVGPVIELAAPGVNINSTFKDGGYQTWSGTSMACPHVAGAAALAWASGLNSPLAVQVRLWNTAEDLGPAGRDPSYGYGLVDAEAAAGGGTPPDAPPSVTITNPAAGATVSGTIAVTADAGDDHGVTRVQFFVDGGTIGTDTDGSDGWSVSWDTTQYSNGPHTVGATATDTASQTANNFVGVTVANESQTDNPPTVTITGPAAGATVSGTITVTADAGDDHGVTRVQFFVDGGTIGTDTDGSDGWSVSWDTTQYSNGPHTVGATATDTASQTANNFVGVTVANETQTDNPPTVVITNPTAGDTVSGTITVRANAGDDKGVTQVQFFVDEISIGTDTDGSDGWSASWDTTGSSNGSCTVSATATDTIGQTGSDSAGVTVDNAQNLPVAKVTVSASTMTITRKLWMGMVEIWVKESNVPLVGATVEGYWSGLYSKTVVETTDGFGFVGLLTKSLRTPGAVTFTVTGVAKGGHQYILDPPEPSASTEGP